MAYRSILLLDQMIVNGVLLQEKKDLTTTVNDETGVKEIRLTHTRIIGQKSYTSKQSIIDGEKRKK